MENINTYSNIPVSDKTTQGMTLTIDDRAYLQRMFSLQDEVTQKFINDTYDAHAKIIIGVVREMMEEQNEKIFRKIDEQNKVIKEIQGLIVSIQDELRNHDARIKKLESRVQKLFIEHKSNHNC